jgi:multicomponent Na+:H+ antiporter subunit E
VNLSPLLILGLSMIWCLIVGEFNLRQWIVGLVLGAVIILATGWGRGQKISVAKLPHRLLFLVFFTFALVPYHIIQANLHMAWRLLRGRRGINPGIVRIRSGELTELALGLEEQVITLTPGQLVVDYSADDEVVYVHVIDVGEYERAGEGSILWMHQILKRIWS